MAYYKKNKRRFDPRYFMNERLEDVSEITVPGPSVGFDVESSETETMRQRPEEEPLESERGDEEGFEFTIHIKVFPEQAEPNILSGNDLEAMVETAKIWKENPAVTITYMSPEIEDKLNDDSDLEES